MEGRDAGFLSVIILNTLQIQVMRICSKFGIFVASDLIDSVWDQDWKEEDES